MKGSTDPGTEGVGTAPRPSTRMEALQSSWKDGSSRDPGGAWVVVPAFNEAPVLRGVIKPLLGRGYRVVVVDDGSQDAAEEELKGLCVHYCRHAVNLGQGAALQTGITHALRQGAAFVVTFDADGQHQSSDVEVLLQPLRAGTCQVTLGSRFKGTAPGIPGLRKLLLLSGASLHRLALRMRITDVHNGLRAFCAEAAGCLDITQNRMAHATQILRQIRRHGLSYQEIPVTVVYTDYSLAKGQRLTNVLNVIWESAAGVFRR